MQHSRTRYLAITTCALAIALATACGGSDGPSDPGPDPGPPTSVAITTGDTPPPRFIPVNATVGAGGQVNWRNASPVAHNLRATTDNWVLNRDLPIGARVNTTIEVPGTYGYECTIHPGMTGTVVVVE